MHPSDPLLFFTSDRKFDDWIVEEDVLVFHYCDCIYNWRRFWWPCRSSMAAAVIGHHKLTVIWIIIRWESAKKQKCASVMRERERSAGLFEVHLEMLDWRWPRFPASPSARFHSALSLKCVSLFQDCLALFYPILLFSSHARALHTLCQVVFLLEVCFAVLQDFPHGSVHPPRPSLQYPIRHADRQQKI